LEIATGAPREQEGIRLKGADNDKWAANATTDVMEDQVSSYETGKKFSA